MIETELNLKKTSLGIELGSTRIKGVLLNSELQIVAEGEHEWKSHLKNNLWTYNLDDVWEGIQSVYKQIADKVKKNYGILLSSIGYIGVSGMMHGFIPFDYNGNQLIDFRTWRNTNTKEASKQLTDFFKVNIPLRWSVAHLYQAIMDQEKFINEIDFVTTLSGYVHWKLTGEKVLGVGDASGMFPISYESVDYNAEVRDLFNELTDKYNFNKKIEDIFPKIQKAGEYGGTLSDHGANLLDPSMTLEQGSIFCPPEGDAGTGMIATNNITPGKGNISAGTSLFSMVVLSNPLSNYYEEIDIVNTPNGEPVAMVHCNNFTSDINDWVSLFFESFKLLNIDISYEDVFSLLFKQAELGDYDAGNIYNCGYFTGEPITKMDEGIPLLLRMPNSNFNISNFMRAQIYSSLATLKIGMDILIQKEAISIEELLGHGGFFITPKVGQQLMADALNTPISLMETANSGGAWGIALLAAYLRFNTTYNLKDFLNKLVFCESEVKTISPDKEGAKSFNEYIGNYNLLLNVEKTATDNFK